MCESCRRMVSGLMLSCEGHKICVYLLGGNSCETTLTSSTCPVIFSTQVISDTQRFLFGFFCFQSKSCDPSPHLWQTASVFLWGDSGYCFSSTALFHIINYGLSTQHTIMCKLCTSGSKLCELVTVEVVPSKKKEKEEEQTRVRMMTQQL